MRLSSLLGGLLTGRPDEMQHRPLRERRRSFELLVVALAAFLGALILVFVIP